MVTGNAAYIFITTVFNPNISEIWEFLYALQNLIPNTLKLFLAYRKPNVKNTSAKTFHTAADLI